MEKVAGMGWGKIFKRNKKTDNPCVCEEWWRSKDKKKVIPSLSHPISLSLSHFMCAKEWSERNWNRLKKDVPLCVTHTIYDMAVNVRWQFVTAIFISTTHALTFSLSLSHFLRKFLTTTYIIQIFILFFSFPTCDDFLTSPSCWYQLKIIITRVKSLIWHRVSLERDISKGNERDDVKNIIRKIFFLLWEEKLNIFHAAVAVFFLSAHLLRKMCMSCAGRKQ